MRAASRNLIFAFATLALGAVTPAKLAAQTVSYDYGAFVLLDAPPSLAELGSYAKRSFTPATGRDHAITANHAGKRARCDLAAQDAARTGGSTPTTVPLVVFLGCPFTMPFMDSERWITLREPLTIEVTDIRDGVVSVAERATVPFVAEPGHLPFPVPTAVGVSWRITRPGLRFTTEAGEFTTGNNGATVRFTADGVRLSGFRATPRLKNAVPASNGWARETVRTVQERLTRLGYRPGPVDGLWGSRTRDALVAFQRSAGLEGSGRLDARTLLELGI